VVKPPVVEPPVVKVPELQFITIEVEGSGGATTAPSNRKLIPGGRLQLRATGVFDGSSEDLTAKVDWTSLPEKVATVSKTGQVSGVSVGEVTIKASQGRIANEIQLMVDEDRDPPRMGDAILMELQVSPKGLFEATLGEVHNFRVTASYNNGKTADWSKAVVWGGSGDVVEIDKNGVARMKALGRASLSVGLKEPVTAVHAAEGVYKGTIARIDVTVLGAASKTPVKLPAAGKMSKDAALVLVKNLVYLADPQFMKSAPPTKLAKLTPSGDAEIDRLLELTADVVNKWNELKTLPDARQIWQKAQPRLSVLLTEAEGPKVGVKHGDLAPALDAVVNISSRVKSGPGNVASSQPNTRPQTADILHAAVYVKTPYGELFYMQDKAADFKRLTDPIEAVLPQAPKAYAALEARLKEQTTELTAIAPFIKSPDAAKAEIIKFASNTTVVDAHIADLANDLTATIRDSLKSAQRDLSAAQRHFVEAENDLKNKKEVDELREEAKKLRERADHAFEIVGGAIEAIIGAVEHAPSAVFKGAFDVISGLIKEYGDQSLNSRAIALEDKAHKLEMESFAEHIKNAAENVADAMATLGDVTTRLAKVEKNFERDRDFAEDGFDDNCKQKGLACKFHFGELRAGLITAQKTYDKAIFSWRLWASLVVLGGMLQAEYAKLQPLQTGQGWDEHEKPYRIYADIKARNKAVLDALLKDATKFQDASAKQMAAAEKLTQDLNTLRVTANLAMANVPRRKGP
jgi:hypothetical protein